LPDESLKQVLEETRTVANERDRAVLLSILALRLPKKLLKDVLEEARTIRTARNRASVLCILAQRLPEVTGDALAITQIIGDEWYREQVLGKLVQNLPSVPKEVLEGIRTNKKESSRRIFRIFVRRLNKLTWDIDDRRIRDLILRNLLIELPEYLSKAYKEIIMVAGASILRILAQNLPKKFLSQVLKEARKIWEPGNRSSVLITLAQRLPEISGDALISVRKISNPAKRTIMLSKLVQLLPGVAGETLETARTIDDLMDRSATLSKLNQPLLILAIKDSYFCLSYSLPKLSQRGRANLLSDIAALMPIIFHLGTDDTPREIYAAVRDVTAWWP
jgi:hypothetical protein